MTTRRPHRVLHAVPEEETGPNSRVRQPQGDETWCEANRAVFLTLLNAPPPANASKQRHHDYESYTTMARDWCANRCPRFAECLQQALSSPGIDGFVAGTTETERKRLRDACGVTPEVIDMDHMAGVKPPAGRACDVHATAAMIAARPQATFKEIADRLGISVATVKRHCRKIAAEQEADTAPEPTSDELRAEAVTAWQHMFHTA